MEWVENSIAERAKNTRSPKFGEISEVRKLIQGAEGVIDLGYGEPDFDTPVHIRDAAKKALDEGYTHYVLPVEGLTELREAIARKLLKENNIHADPATEILVTAGVQEATNVAVLSLINPGDEVIMPEPYYYSDPLAVMLAGGTPVYTQLKESNDYRLDLEDLKSKITPKTKAIFFISPNCPTGAVFPKEDLQALAAIAKEKNIFIITDEIYERLVYDDQKHYSISSLTVDGIWHKILKLFIRAGFQPVISDRSWTMSEKGAVFNGGENKGLSELKAEVMETDACTACGTCVFTCPYIHTVEDRVAAVSDCRIIEGSCYLTCPRSEPASEISNVYGDAGFGGALGPVLDFVMARSTLVQDVHGVQYGGIVTTLLLKALESGLVNQTVVTRETANMPFPFVAGNRDEIMGAAGSKYAVAPTNKEVNRMIRDDQSRMAVVALPCQATGLRKKQLHPSERDQGDVKLVIGLFCTWALSQKGWRNLLKKYLGEASVQRVHIPPPPAQSLEIITDQCSHLIPLEEVRSFIRPGCQVCLDMTAENGDISVGMVEGKDGWNTVITRTERGRALWQDAVASGDIEVETLDESRWEHLQAASLIKKQRAIAAAEKRKVSEPLPYYERLQKLNARIGGEVS